MMWKVARPDATDVREQLRSALTHKNGKAVYRLTKPAINKILSLYKQYDDALGRGTPSLRNGGLSEKLNSALYVAYSQVQKGRRLADLRARLLAAVDLCPMCRINVVTDLDHHLARSIYRPFSVYIRNLVPSCGTCNNAKRAVGGAPAEEFLHPYFAALPEGRFLTAECAIQDGALTIQFGIARLAGIDTKLYDRMVSQFNRLQLHERYQKGVNIFLVSQVESFKMAYGEDRNSQQVAQLARITARTMEHTTGINDWRPVVLYAVARCEEFCDGGFENALGQKP